MKHFFGNRNGGMMRSPSYAYHGSISEKSLPNGEKPRHTITEHSKGVHCILAFIREAVEIHQHKFGFGIEIQSCMVCRIANGGIIMMIRKNRKVLEKHEISDMTLIKRLSVT
jgi:hypothetical protein